MKSLYSQILENTNSGSYKDFKDMESGEVLYSAFLDPGKKSFRIEDNPELSYVLLDPMDKQRNMVFVNKQSNGSTVTMSWKWHEVFDHPCTIEYSRTSKGCAIIYTPNKQLLLTIKPIIDKMLNDTPDYIDLALSKVGVSHA